MSFWKQLRAIVAAPGLVLVIAPALIVWLSHSLHPGWGRRGPLMAVALALGGAVTLAGLALLARSIGLFATVGEGTLAPWDPTRRLVVTGLYRYTRNPMYLGVLITLIGEVALSGSLPLLAYGLLVTVAFNVFVRLYEEPTLRRVYGAEYDAFTANVPRWLPRRTPWEGGEGS